MKRYRTDIKKWETKMKVLCFITVYKYELFQYKTKYRLFFPMSGAKYFVFKQQPPITITQKEIDEKYNGNKWTVPVNYQIV